MKQALGYSEFKPLLDRFVGDIQQCHGENLLSIVLYGSVARETASFNSDVDLLLVLDKATKVYWKRLESITPILMNLRGEKCWKELEEAGITLEINVLIFSREEADQNRYLYLDMIEEARILVDRGGFFRGRLRKFEKRLAKLGAKKIPIDGAWYWDLKPDLKKGEIVVL